MEAKKGCLKCGHTEVAQDTIAVTSTGFAKMFDIQNKKYNTITCKNCGYTEFYAANVSTGENLLDIFFG